jgi:hypothetical protein
VLLTEGRPPPPATRDPGEAVEEGLLGGLSALIIARVRVGEGMRLTALLADLIELMLTPYLGREAARKAARDATV